MTLHMNFFQTMPGNDHMGVQRNDGTFYQHFCLLSISNVKTNRTMALKPNVFNVMLSDSR